MVVGSDKGRWPGQATCVRMTGIEGVTSHQGREGRWDDLIALSSLPFCFCDSRPGEAELFIRRAQVHGRSPLAPYRIDFAGFCGAF